MTVLSSVQMQLEIEKLAASANELFVASAYVTDSAIEWLSRILRNESPVQVVCRAKPEDFLSGSSTLAALEQALDNGWEVRINENLHTKIYMADRARILLGSSNLTRNGLALSVSGNIEANTSLQANPSSLEFIDAIWNSSIELTSDKLMMMEECLNSIDSAEDKQLLVWPDVLFEEPISELFVEDFPSKPFSSNKSANNKYSVIDHYIEQDNFEQAQKLFSMLRLTKWFLNQLVEHGEIRFGHLSKLMHTDLAEDPRVYRKDLKQMQSNFLEYVDRLLPEVEKVQPVYTSVYRLKK
jgi:hypothetical protein